MDLKYKSILLGIAIGVFGTTLVFFLIGDIDIQTEIQLGEKSNQNDKNIRISIEKNIDKNGEEIINVSAIGSGSVTKEDIEKELEKLFADKNIDASEGIEVNITLDKEIDFE